MHFLWPKEMLHTSWYMERRVPEIMCAAFYFHWTLPSDADERIKIYMENIKAYPIRLENSGMYGAIYLLRNHRWSKSGINDERLS